MAQRRPKLVKVKPVGPLARLKKVIFSRFGHGPAKTREYERRLKEARKRMAA